MLYSGLCSIFFRNLSIDATINLCQKAKTDGIEWSSDIHLPPDEIALVSERNTKTEAAGLNIRPSGAYDRCDEKSEPLSDVHCFHRAKLAGKIVAPFSMAQSNGTPGDFNPRLADTKLSTYPFCCGHPTLVWMTSTPESVSI